MEGLWLQGVLTVNGMSLGLLATSKKNNILIKVLDFKIFYFCGYKVRARVVVGAFIRV